MATTTNPFGLPGLFGNSGSFSGMNRPQWGPGARIPQTMPNPFEELDEYGRPRRKRGPLPPFGTPRQGGTTPYTLGANGAFMPAPGATPMPGGTANGAPVSFTTMAAQMGMPSMAPTAPAFGMMGDVAPTTPTKPGTEPPVTERPATPPTPLTKPMAGAPTLPGGVPGDTTLGAGFGIEPIDALQDPEAIIVRALQGMGRDPAYDRSPQVQALRRRAQALVHNMIGRALNADTVGVSLNDLSSTQNINDAATRMLRDALSGQAVFGMGAGNAGAGQVDPYGALQRMQMAFDPAHTATTTGARVLWDYLDNPSRAAQMIADISYGGQSRDLQNTLAAPLSSATGRYQTALEGGEDIPSFIHWLMTRDRGALGTIVPPHLRGL